jgi:hypothetical protein
VLSVRGAILVADLTTVPVVDLTTVLVADLASVPVVDLTTVPVANLVPVLVPVLVAVPVVPRRVGRVPFPLLTCGNAVLRVGGRHSFAEEYVDRPSSAG